MTAQTPDSGPAGGFRAFVAFSGRTELNWLRLLKPGYRHCFAVIEIVPAGTDAPTWILYNPLSVGTQLAAWSGLDGRTVCAHLRAEGFDVIETRIPPLGRRVLGWRPYTCVEAVKRVLGLRAPWIVTPWQLRQHLENKNRKKYIDMMA